ncbi:hypothetical protein EWM64_g906 [Hericium alpestre]|uniref:Uncharacterized protein n=1 Tax=Hericium alpestre TaxID=135208 RepID=A0A4Z0A9W8_9AGAM|nr:hypothetical protein EWM64_g906 [Hericium alpestre]
MAGAAKRKLGDAADNERRKRPKAAKPSANQAGTSASAILHAADGTTPTAEPTTDQPTAATDSTVTPSSKAKEKQKIKKLSAPRPFPTVPTSVSATGPRSAHHEGKNYIAVTRKTPLGAYLRRCKDIVLKDGYKTLHLSAMGAAIPHLSTLAVSIPLILPFPADEIHTEVLTGTVEVQDELIPEDEDEDISYRTRGKSTLSIVIKIGDGVDEKAAVGGKWATRGKRRSGPATIAQAGQSNGKGSERIFVEVPEQDDMDQG